MARNLRLEDFKLAPKDPIVHPLKPDKFYCYRCSRYHLIYSDVGNDHKDYNTPMFSSHLFVV